MWCAILESYIVSARPKTTNYADFFVGSNFNPPVSEVRDSEILNVFLRLKLSPALNSTEFAGFRSDTSQVFYFNHFRPAMI